MDAIPLEPITSYGLLLGPLTLQPFGFFTRAPFLPPSIPHSPPLSTDIESGMKEYPVKNALLWEVYKSTQI